MSQPTNSEIMTELRSIRKEQQEFRTEITLAIQGSSDGKTPGLLMRVRELEIIEGARHWLARATIASALGALFIALFELVIHWPKLF